MKNQEKEIYETPKTKRTRVKLENSICVASDRKPGDDVNSDRHVSIEGHKGGDSFTFESTSWE
ncbi:hypothetical protein [Bacteroides caecigallinarum]|uniref:hypothetical protein n=1 Tax=Bacteroides caecigallinarum TaxID=1411144 RepID=UPI001F255A5F|nr:hypothetical protein [Bacteroides caecigallinarum]MCF2736353.1 hypothetical protein [Bacteroides caecigallinarum]